MRTISAANEALFTAVGGRRTFLRVDVKDAGGTWRDLTTYPGENMVLSASWGESVDSPGMSGSVVLKREIELLSLAPLMDTSALNLAFNPSGTPAPLLFNRRELKIFTATIPDDLQPAAGDWIEAFHGRIDKIDWGKKDVVELKISDMQGDIRDTFIERERVYAHADPADPDATKGLYIFELGRAYLLNDLLCGTEAKRNGMFYRISIAGTSSTTVEPTYPTTPGGTVMSGTAQLEQKGNTTITTGTAVEDVIEQILADNGLPITLEVPSSPGWLVKWFLRTRVNCWEAVRALVDQIGYDLRYKWHAGSSSFKLTFSAIDRAKSSPDRTFSKSEKISITELSIDVADVRNVVRVVFSNSAVLDSDKNPIRDFVERTSSGSVSIFGRRFMEIQESSSSNIDTTAEATAMADAALADLALPNATQGVAFEYFPFVELGDLYRFSGDEVHHSGNLDLAVVSYQHAVTSDGLAETTMSCRGKPSGGVERWLARAAEINTEDTHRFSVFSGDALNILTNGDVIGGGGAKNLAFQQFSKHALPVGFDIHLSKTSSFTPDASNLVLQQQGTKFTYGEGDPGETYYGQTIPWQWNQSRKVRGLPSPEWQFVAGYLRPKHVHPEEFQGETPLNGSFDTYSRAEGVNTTPDQWEMETGTWATDVTFGPAKGGADPVNGSKYLRFLGTSVATAVRSKWFPVIGSHVYELTSWWYRVSGDNSFAIEVEFVTFNKGAISTTTITLDQGDLVSTAWNQIRKVIVAPATAAFARVRVKKSSAHSDTGHVDAVRLKWVGEPWIEIAKSGESAVQVGSFSNSWAPLKGGTLYCRPENGRGWFSGGISAGTINTTAVTLPAALWPPRTLRAPVVDSAGAIQELEINASGQVKQLAGSTGGTYLDQVSWPLS